jgi:hypothetical protein
MALAATPVTVSINPENIDKNIKIATSNLLVDQSPQKVDKIADLLFQDFGVSELITNTPNFSLLQYSGGQNYTVTNISEIVRTSFSANIPAPATSTLSAISSYQPTSGNGPNGVSVYFDANNQFIYVELVSMDNGRLMEYQIVSQANTLDATI